MGEWGIEWAGEWETGLWAAAVAGAGATYFWRGLGVALSRHLRPSGPLFEWVSCIAYGLLAGLVARMIVLPVGALQDTAMSARLGAAAVALAVYFLTRRNQFAGIVAGTGAMILWIW